MKPTNWPATRAEILQYRDALVQWSNDLLQMAYRAEAFSIEVHKQCRARRLWTARLVFEKRGLPGNAASSAHH
jgi:hypothetical protein